MLNHRFIALVAFAVFVLLLWGGFWSSSAPVLGRGIRYIPSSIDWSKEKTWHPVVDMMSPPEGTPKGFPKVQARSTGGADRKKRDAVKKAFRKSWKAYKKFAWAKDELLPISASHQVSLSGWGAQLVDALDLLWIMDYKKEFYLAVKEVAVLDFGKYQGDSVNLFEVTIRYLGGILAAYDLSGEPALLAKAIELGDTLYFAFDTPNRLPSHWLVYEKAFAGETTAETSMSGAAGGSLSLEFTRLSQITGNPKYYDATERIKKFFYRFQNETQVPGLWPHTMNYRDETMDGSHFTLGAGADSLYEYLPKMDSLLGGLDPQYKQMTIRSLEAARDTLLYRPMTRKDENILASGDGVVSAPGRIVIEAKMEHLACFLGGTYGLAGKLLGRDDFVDIASRLAAGCVWAYDSFPTNVMPESSRLVPCEKMNGPCPYDKNAYPDGRHDNLPHGFSKILNTRYLLRPEAIESVFYMWRMTGDQVWRDAAWRMWEGIAAEAETDLAYAVVEDVTRRGAGNRDKMETFWMAETIKYFYLIFEDHGVINLDEWVLNTEAHPLKRLLPK